LRSCGICRRPRNSDICLHSSVALSVSLTVLVLVQAVGVGVALVMVMALGAGELPDTVYQEPLRSSAKSIRQFRAASPTWRCPQ